MFISEESLKERTNLSNRNLDSIKFNRDRDQVKPETDESERVNSAPLRPCDVEPELEIKILPRRGRVEGYRNRTEEERTKIGVDARLLGQTEAAKVHNVSQAFAGLCEKGKSNTNAATPVDSVKAEKVNSEINELRNRALAGLTSSVGILNGKLSESMKTGEAVSVAATLVKIVSISTPDEKRDQASRLIIMAPQLREERLYETIDIG